MNKIKLAAILACTVLVSSSVLSACNKKVDETQYEIANYQGQLEEGAEQSDYNKALFYRNDKKTNGADPFVLDNTSRDGYYYMYTTDGSFSCFRSKNMTDWEKVGNALDNLHYDASGNSSEERRVTNDALWAPEVVYDASADNGEGMYYLFFSATPAADTNVKPGNGVASCNPIYLPYVAASKYAYKGFKLVNFKDAESCGEENVHTYNETPGITDGESGEYKDAFPHYYAKYIFLEPGRYYDFCESAGVNLELRAAIMGKYVGAIDPHPFVAADGKKYMYWVVDCGQNGIIGMEMENWLKPKWETAKLLTMSRFYTVADYLDSKQGKNVETVSYELGSNNINEGMCMTEHNGKYYLTFSVNNYTDNSYQVVQAVADSPLGPFRKLTDAEGAVMLSGSRQGSLDVTGTGHHSFVTIDGKTYIVYHRHDDPVAMGDVRNPAIDEVRWVTIKDKDGNDLDVMYANGPTNTVQPALVGEYKNIAEEASVSGTDDAKYLNDGLLSLYANGNSEFMDNIKETVIKGETTFTFGFETARKVRAIMVYNSKNASSIFKAVKRIELVCEEDGQEVIRFIKDLKFSKEYYRADDLYDVAYYVTPGAAAYAEFGELNVKSVRITIEVPEGQPSVGISEVRILGK